MSAVTPNPAKAGQDTARVTSADIQAKAAGSSFYAGMRVLPKREREGMYAVYGYCRAVDDIADDLNAAPAARRAELAVWRADLEALYSDRPAGRADYLAPTVRRFGLRKADFLAVIDGMEMDLDQDICAPDTATLDLYVDRVACAVGRLSVKIFGMDEQPGQDLAHHLGRALQLTNILRDMDEDAAIGRLYVPRDLLSEAHVEFASAGDAAADPRLDMAARALARRAQAEFAAAEMILRSRPGGRLIAPRLMSAAYSRILARMISQGWAPPRRRVRIAKPELFWIVLRHALLG